MDISVKRRANTRAPNGVADRIVNQRRRPFAETRGRRNDLTRLLFVTSRVAGDKKITPHAASAKERLSTLSHFIQGGNYA